MNAIHNRMPVILDAKSAKEWVAAGELTNESLEAFATPHPDEKMMAFIVSRLVNNPRNEGPAILGED